MGAFFVHKLDERMQRTRPFFVRFMYDVLVLAPTRWKIRKAVKMGNGILGSLGLESTRTRPSSGALSGASTFWAIISARTGTPWLRRPSIDFVALISSHHQLSGIAPTVIVKPLMNLTLAARLAPC